MYKSGLPFKQYISETITDPNGRIIYNYDTDLQTVNFFPMSSLIPDISGKDTFTIKNMGDSPVNVRIEYGSLAPIEPQTTITQNVTNTRTTAAQFETVSVSGSC